MKEKILWRTPQIRSTIFFFLISPWWLYLMYCFSFSQSIFSSSAFKIVIYNYWFLFLSSMMISTALYYLWYPAILFAILHSLVTFYFSSMFLFATTNKLYLSFNIIFFIASGLNILFWIRDASFACYQKKHYVSGFFGQILKSIKGKLVLPPNQISGENNKIETIDVELIDWDEQSIKMKLHNAPTDISFLAEYDLGMKIFYQDKEFSLKAHSTIWSPEERVLGVRVIKEDLGSDVFVTDFDSFCRMTQSMGHEAKLLY